MVQQHYNQQFLVLLSVSCRFCRIQFELSLRVFFGNQNTIARLSFQQYKQTNQRITIQSQSFHMKTFLFLVLLAVSLSEQQITSQTNQKPQTYTYSTQVVSSRGQLSVANNTATVVTNEIFLTLFTGDTFDTIVPQDQIKRKVVSNYQPNSIFIWQPINIPNVFYCRLIFGSGVPNQQIGLTFSYNYKRITAQLNLKIDLLHPISQPQPKSPRSLTQQRQNI